MKLTDIIKATRAEVFFFHSDIDVNSVSTDTRTIKNGDIFLALKGKNFSGSNFVCEAIKKGACAVITGNDKGSLINQGVPILIVSDTENALSLIAGMHRSRFAIPVIAVTGTNGKTTTKDVLSHILSKKFKVLKTHRNYNNNIGVAKTLLGLAGHEIAVIEAGINSQGEMAGHAAVIKPDIVITTNIGSSHLSGLHSLSGILEEKMNMVKSLDSRGVWIKNIDNEPLRSAAYNGIKTMTFGIENDKAEFNAGGITYGENGMRFLLNGKFFSTPLIGRHNIYNCLACIAASSMFMGLDTISSALLSFSPAEMRMKLCDCGEFTILDDTYNSNPDSLKSAVTALGGFRPNRRKLFVCADMLELGGHSEKLHYECGKFIAQSGFVDMLILYGENVKSLAKGAADWGMDKNCIVRFDSKNETADFLRSCIRRHDCVLLKGSRSMRLESVIENLRCGKPIKPREE
jgi:UDP-N-acetylmuramoyl-tripeptide--D-alanyl-D-alanine ligase